MMAERMSEERLKEIREWFDCRPFKAFGNQSRREAHQEWAKWPADSLTAEMQRSIWTMELLAEVERLRAYEADTADRFAAVVRQRDKAELRLNSLGYFNDR